MLKKFILFCLCCSFITNPLYAKNWNLGAKIAYVEPDHSLIKSSDNADNIGFLLGYNWFKSFGTIGIEADYTTSYLDESVGEFFFIDTLGVHVNLKNLGHATNLGLYGKLKAGATYFKVTNANSLKEEEVKLSFGGGLGMNLGRISVELEYIMINDFNMFSFAILY